MIKESSRAYGKGKYKTRKKLDSFKSKKSNHVLKAQRMFGVKAIRAGRPLARKTGCTVATLRKIERKGMGAYFSSGSRPNQTAQSWGRARLASAITGGKAAAVDLSLIEKGCERGGRVVRLARKSAKRHKRGQRKTPKYKVGGANMKEKILRFERGPRFKKYTAYVENKETKKTRKIHFGDNRYQQYKDRTPLALYKSGDHGEKKRQENYYSRHSGTRKRKEAIDKEVAKSKGVYNPKILSHIYLW